MKLENQTILIVSNEAWGPVWYSKHNYANELSKRNRVYFVDPPGKWHPKFLFKSKPIAKKIQNNLYLISYKNSIPASGRVKLLFHLNEWIISKRIKGFLKKHKVGKSLMWTFDPYRLVFPKKIGVDYALYHYADDYHNYGFEILLKNVDLILSISPAFEEIISQTKKPYLITNHSISEKGFQTDESFILPSGIKNGYVLFIGTIDDRLDFSIIDAFIQCHPDLQFLFLGQKVFESWDDVGRKIFNENYYPNVYALGVVNFDDLRHYIARSLICIAPMIETVRGNHINHQKLLQYMAHGKEVVCPEFSDYKGRNDLLCFYNSPETALNAFQQALANASNQQKRESKIAYARSFCFEKQLVLIENFISKVCI